MPDNYLINAVSFLVREFTPEKVIEAIADTVEVENQDKNVPYELRNVVQRARVREAKR